MSDLDIGAELGKKIGPLPLGGWLLVAGGGAAAAWYTRRQMSAGSTAAATTGNGLQATDPGTVDSGATSAGVGGAVGTEVPVTEPTPIPAEAPRRRRFGHARVFPIGPAFPAPGRSIKSGGRIRTNTAWIEAAIEHLRRAGYLPHPSTVALQHFTEGRALNPFQRNIVEEAIARTGPPPQTIHRRAVTSKPAAHPGAVVSRRDTGEGLPTHRTAFHEATR